jgi:hypothetical protein
MAHFRRTLAETVDRDGCGSIIDNRIELPGVEQFDAKSAEIRQFLRGEPDQGRTRELMEEMRTAGLPT